MGDRRENKISFTAQQSTPRRTSDPPWSSDDEDNTPQSGSISFVQEILPGESRQSTGERAGTSSMSGGINIPSITPMRMRRNQARDRDMFWSYLANSPRLSELVSRCRSGANRGNLQRLLDLRRDMSALSHQRHRGNRSTGGGSGVQTTRSASSIFAMERADASHLSTLGQYSGRSSPSLSSAIAAARRSPSPLFNRPLLLSPPSSLLRRPRLEGTASAEHSDDDVEMTGVSAPPHENEEPNEDEVPHAPEISLEEEIVEIECRPQSPVFLVEERAGDAEGVGSGDTQQPAEEARAPRDDRADADDVQEIPVTNATTESQQHGVKRKRNSAEDDPATVNEFNQWLLRVLECPVCLESMEPPLSQCRRGHLICARCRARVQACPVCRCAFSSVRNRAMEAVADMLRYPCRHGCGRDMRLWRRRLHEASCPARRYRCVEPACTVPQLQRDQLVLHVQNQHTSMLKMGVKHRLTVAVYSETHDNWLVVALRELFHLRLDVDPRSWGVAVSVAYIGPKRRASSYLYEVTVNGQQDSRRMTYVRATHCDLEVRAAHVSRHDCFALTANQALHFMRPPAGPDADKCLEINIEIKHGNNDDTERNDSDS